MNKNKESNNGVTIENIMEKTFEVYKRVDEDNDKMGCSEWTKISEKGVRVIDGGYAKLFSLNKKHYIVSNGNIVYPAGTVLELTQESAEKYLTNHPYGGVDGKGTFCVSSHGPALDVMSVGKQVESQEAESVLEAIAMGKPKFVPGKPCPCCGGRHGGSPSCLVCGDYKHKL